MVKKNITKGIQVFAFDETFTCSVTRDLFALKICVFKATLKTHKANRIIIQNHSSPLLANQR